MPGKVVLIVDDERELVVNCERLLRRLGHTCLRAHTGTEALALIDREGPDLVVTDLRLPGLDGLSIARRARAHVPPIPVVLITAYDSLLARGAAREHGVATYLPKPFSNASFLEAIQRALPPGPGPGDGATAEPGS